MTAEIINLADYKRKKYIANLTVETYLDKVKTALSSEDFLDFQEGIDNINFYKTLDTDIQLMIDGYYHLLQRG